MGKKSAEQPDVFLAGRTRTMRQCSSDARSEGQSGDPLDQSHRARQMETEYNQDHQQRDGAMAFVECPAVVTGEGIGEGKIGATRHGRSIGQFPRPEHATVALVGWLTASMCVTFRRSCSPPTTAKTLPAPHIRRRVGARRPDNLACCAIGAFSKHSRTEEIQEDSCKRRGAS